jgi:hypothetical protein
MFSTARGGMQRENFRDPHNGPAKTRRVEAPHRDEYSPRKRYSGTERHHSQVTHMKRMSIVLLAFLIVTIVPALEYMEWKNETRGLAPETGRVTKIEQRQCRAGSTTRRSTCKYATIEYPLSAEIIGVLTPSSPIPFHYQTNDRIPLLVDPTNREHVLLVDRNDKVFAFVGLPSIFAVSAFVILLAGSRFVRPD